MSEIFNGLVSQAEWLDVGFNVTRQGDPIDRLFGDEKTDNIQARWQSIANEIQIPMMAQFHGFDTEAQQTFSISVDNHNIEKGLIKVKINQSELMRQYKKNGIIGNAQLKDFVLNDGIRLAEQVFTRTKVAKNELMATGKVTIKENNLNLTVDYGVPADHLNKQIDLAGDVFGQIQTIVDDAAAKGVTINGMMTSKATITAMRKAKSVQIAINGANATGATVKRSAFEEYLETELGISDIVTNDLTYGAASSLDENGRPVITSKRYYPANTITFFMTNPSGRLGVGLWGNPPEVDLAEFGDKVNAETAVSPYVYVTQYKTDDPAVIWTKASGLFIPVLYNPDSLYVASVTNTGA